MKKEWPTMRQWVMLLAIGNGRFYGLEIQRRINEITAGDYSLHQGSLYPTLKQLETKKWVFVSLDDRSESRGRGPMRTYYTLTELGKGVVEKVLSAQQSFIESSFPDTD